MQLLKLIEAKLNSGLNKIQKNVGNLITDQLNVKSAEKYGEPVDTTIPVSSEEALTYAGPIHVKIKVKINNAERKRRSTNIIFHG